MSKLYEAYENLRKEYDAATLVAFQIGDAFEFFNEDADTVADILGLEVGLRAIGKNMRVPIVQVLVSEADKAFKQLLENGFTVAVCEQTFSEDGSIAQKQKEIESEPEPEEDEPEFKVKLPKRTHVVQAPADVDPVGGETTCVRCSKPLSRDQSVERGMGEVCASHGKHLGDTTLEEHYQNLNLPELTDDYIPMRQYLDAGIAVGITEHRMVKAAGGDRALRRPVHPSFQVYYFLGKRFVHKDALDNIEEARLK